MDYIQQLATTADIDSITAIHQQKQLWVNQNKKGFLRYREPYERLSRFRAQFVDCSSDIVTIGMHDEIDEIARQQVKNDLRQFMPWRKGPFSVFGIDIDAEWRSERKWNRVTPALPDLKNKMICDIGCNNGYYMFRMNEYKPALVIGLEPSVQHYYCFKSLNSIAGFTNLHIDLLGVEHVSFFTQTFDVIFLMGIIYHRPSPIEVLQNIYSALREGGTLIVESQAIPGEDPIALFPEKTYAKVPGTYFVPTGKCLANWMKRAGFGKVKLFDSHSMSNEEQRKTDWMTFESYQDFIDQKNHDLTVEGYKAPVRVFLRGKKE